MNNYETVKGNRVRSMSFSWGIAFPRIMQHRPGFREVHLLVFVRRGCTRNIVVIKCGITKCAALEFMISPCFYELGQN